MLVNKAHVVVGATTKAVVVADRKTDADAAASALLTLTLRENFMIYEYGKIKMWVDASSCYSDIE